MATSSHRATHSNNRCGVSGGAREPGPGPPRQWPRARAGSSCGSRAPPGGRRRQLRFRGSAPRRWSAPGSACGAGAGPAGALGARAAGWTRAGGGRTALGQPHLRLQRPFPRRAVHVLCVGLRVQGYGLLGQEEEGALGTCGGLGLGLDNVFFLPAPRHPSGCLRLAALPPSLYPIAAQFCPGRSSCST